MTAVAPNSDPSSMSWREINHLALVTRDLDATVRFYTEALGMQAGEIRPPNPYHGRTCTIKPYAAATNELHFFEATEAESLPDYPELRQRMVFPSAGLHHISFTMSDAALGLQLQDRLHDMGIWTTPAMEEGDSVILLFFDNNNLLLEANWPKV